MTFKVYTRVYTIKITFYSNNNRNYLFKMNIRAFAINKIKKNSKIIINKFHKFNHINNNNYIYKITINQINLIITWIVALNKYKITKKIKEIILVLKIDKPYKK